MRLPYIRGASLVALLCGFCAVESHAQAERPSTSGPGRFRSAPAPAPGLTPRLLYPGGYQRPARFASMNQEFPDGVPTPGDPFAIHPGSEPSPDGTNVAERIGGHRQRDRCRASAGRTRRWRRRANRSRGRCGETAEAEEAEIDESKLLMNALGRADAPVKIYGWIQNSYTGNTNGVSSCRA